MEKIPTVKEKYPEETRPRERLLAHGPEALADYELLAILLKTGSRGQNVVDLSLSLLNQFGSLYELKQASITELTSFPGIGPIKASELLAACELGYRIAHSAQTKKGKITSTQSAGQYFIRLFHGLQQEQVMAAYLNTKNEVIKIEMVFKGSLNTSVAHPREIFKGAVKYSAARILLAHNHPSGNTEPSQADQLFTKRIVECGEMMGIEVLDHFIVGENDYISLREYGWI